MSTQTTVYKREWMRKWRRDHPQASMIANKRAHDKRRLRQLTPEERKKRIASVVAWQKRYPEKVRARQKVYHAVKKGLLKRQPCWCGVVKVEAHHFDYSKPLEVEWRCKKHHEISDKVRQMAERSGP